MMVLFIEEVFQGILILINKNIQNQIVVYIIEIIVADIIIIIIEMMKKYI
jgi:hypothetical protein